MKGSMIRGCLIEEKWSPVRDAQIMEECEEFVKVKAPTGKTGVDLVNFIPAFDFQNMTKYYSLGVSDWFFERNDSVHAEKGFLSIINLMGMGGWGDNISNSRVFFWQVGWEVHFFPTEFLFWLDSWKPELGSESNSLYKIQSPVYILKNLLIGRSYMLVGWVFLVYFWNPNF